MNNLTKIMNGSSSCVLLRGKNSFLNYKQGLELMKPLKSDIVLKVTDINHRKNCAEGQMIRNEAYMLREIIDRSEMKTSILVYESENDIDTINDILLDIIKDNKDTIAFKFSSEGEIYGEYRKFGMIFYHEMNTFNKLPILTLANLFENSSYKHEISTHLANSLVFREF